MGRSRNIIFVFWGVLYINLLIGQVSGSIFYGASKVLKHSDKILFDAPPYSYLVQASIYRRTDGTKGWDRYWKRPTVGLNLAYLHYGNDDTLGQAWGVFPSMKFDLFRRERFNIGFQAGVGLAYLTKPYNKITNPINNAIGSHWNNVTQFVLSAEANIYKDLSLSLGGHFTHFSNARTATPNSGINTAGLTLGVTKRFSGEKPKVNATVDTIVMERRWGGDVLLGYGLSEYSFTGGSKYASYFINVGGTYKISPYFKVILGGEYEYNQSIFQFYYQDFDPADIARQKATKTAIYGAGDLMFGRFTLRLQTGKYLPLPALSEISAPMYFKLNCIVAPFPTHWSVQPYVGVLLKSHVAVAQYLGIFTGCRF